MANSEAQRIVDELVDELGMQGAAIAREIGVKADTIFNIRRRHSTGNLYTPRLRVLREQMASIAGQRPAASSADMSTLPVIDQLPPTSDVFAPIKETPDPAGVTLNAEEPAPAAPKKLTEKASDWLRAAMLGEPSAIPAPGMTAPSGSRKASKAEAGEQGALIEQLVPLAALLLVLTGSVMLPDPYKSCGPTNDEATAIAYPIIKRAVRELDARKRISEATMDAIAILLAMSAYGVRAHGTYQVIHAEEVQRARSNHPPTAYSGAYAGADAAALAASGGGAVNAAAAPVDAAARPDRQDVPLPFWRQRTRSTTRQPGHTDDGAAAPAERRQADASIDALLAMDHAGRVRLGL